MGERIKRLHGHRYDQGEVYCSRCGVHIAEAEVKKCVPSTVELVREEAND